MKTVRPLWGRGQMVSPQHFQQEAAQAAWHTECVARLGVIHPWGVARTAFDAALLKQGKLKADHLCVRFADGTLTDSDNADVLPPVMTLPETESHELTVVLALPHEYENGGNCLQPEQKAERPVRWRLAWREVRNRYGDDSRQIAVMQPELTLRTEDNDNGNYQTVAVARLKRDSQGDWSQDASFIPPLLNVQASRWPSRPNADVVTAFPAPAKPWKPFVAGMLTMLALAGAAAGGWRATHPSDSGQMRFPARFSPLPAVLSAEQLQTLRQQSPSAETGIKQTQQQLAQLLQLKPDWALSYGTHLAQQALTLWPEQAKPLAQQWQQQVSAAALPVENLSGWHQGMTQLQQLTNRLNALDEQKGRYITVSELKSAVFAITQSLSRTVPAEEQLRQLSAQPRNQPGSAAQQNQTEQHLQQLIARYAALKQKTAE